MASLSSSFVSEVEAILHLHGARSNKMGQNFEAKIVRFDRFLADLKNVTIGIQSDSFKCDEVMIFHMEANITIADVSPLVMQKFVLPFLECGSCYKRLQLMTAKKNLPFLFDGFIFKVSVFIFFCTEDAHQLLYISRQLAMLSRSTSSNFGNL